ncbi:GAF and ANTAR domain-containing protein [Kribbella sp. CA-293567]|uniref:GAF and ANTAR domain-containing protein n=1 Tax=Kribbella sp. CA-293567 TaxID=3002436 RepID=UPI0022DD56BA|nr:GAF and ANTAR domain-containing protein [Kribbella sp. CA-293567]WBQ07924.1 GAF and ANTAR domain-containing protein [Kribbella sp. CA-293567]
MTLHAKLLVRLVTLAASGKAQASLASRLASACQSILGADGAAITVESTVSNRTTLVTTDRVITTLEDLQDVIGEGPCLDAFRHRTHFEVTVNNWPDPRWPEFTRSAKQAVGEFHLYTFPMRPGRQTIGVISIYVDGDRDLPEPVEAAQILADYVGEALLQDPAAEDPDTGPWAAQIQIPQASGMVMAQLALSPADALATLRAHAYANSITLAETARRVVTRELNFRTQP